MPVLTPEEFSAGLRDSVRTGALQRGMEAAGAQISHAALGFAGRRVSGRVLNIRSGALAGTLRAGHRINKDGSVSGWVQAGGMGTKGRVDYARVHETGKPRHITPKTGQYLRIPFDVAKTGAGVDKYQGGLRSQAPDKFRFLSIHGGAAGLLIDKETDKAWYYLVRSVKTKKRPYLAPSVSDALRVHGDSALINHVGGAIRQSLRGVSGGT